MATISLKKLIAKKEVFPLVREMVSAVGVPIGIWDPEGQLLMGDDEQSLLGKYTVELEGEVIGWVSGAKKASSIALLLAYLANRELERKHLARETLDKYREINLLYSISGKLTGNLTLKEVTQIIINETKESIKATSGAILLLDEEGEALETVAAFGPLSDWQTKKVPVEGIISSVIATGIGEIVNDVLSDPRFIAQNDSMSSLICVPLRTKDEVIGVIQISSEQPIQYTSGDLKLLSALASQATSAITNAMFYENMLREEWVIGNLERYF